MSAWTWVIVFAVVVFVVLFFVMRTSAAKAQSDAGGGKTLGDARSFAAGTHLDAQSDPEASAVATSAASSTASSLGSLFG